jgi:hypothetical protein
VEDAFALINASPYSVVTEVAEHNGYILQPLAEQRHILEMLKTAEQELKELKDKNEEIAESVEAVFDDLPGILSFLTRNSDIPPTIAGILHREVIGKFNRVVELVSADKPLDRNELLGMLDSTFGLLEDVRGGCMGDPDEDENSHECDGKCDCDPFENY